MANQTLYLLSLDNTPPADPDATADNFINANKEFIALTNKLTSQFNTAFQYFNNHNTFKGSTEQTGPPTGILPTNFSLPFNFNLPTDALTIYPKFTNAGGARTLNNELPDLTEPIVTFLEAYEIVEPYIETLRAAYSAYVVPALEVASTAAADALSTPEAIPLVIGGLGLGLYKMLSSGSHNNFVNSSTGSNTTEDNSPNFFGGFGGGRFGGGGSSGTWGGSSDGGGALGIWDSIKSFTSSGIFDNNNSFHIDSNNPFAANNGLLADKGIELKLPAVPQYFPTLNGTGVTNHFEYLIKELTINTNNVQTLEQVKQQVVQTLKDALKDTNVAGQ